MFLSKLKACVVTLLTLAVASGLAGAFVLEAPGRGNRDKPQGPAQPSAPAPPQETGFRALLAGVEWLLTDVDPVARTISVDDRRVPGGTNAFTFVTPPGQPVGTVENSQSRITPGGVSLSGLKVEDGATVTVGGKATELTALRAGMRATLRLAKDRPVVVGVVVGNDTGSTPPSTYTLTGINPKRRTITLVDERRGLRLDDLPVATDVRIQLLTNREALIIQSLKLGNLKAGMHLSLELAASEDGPPVVKGITAGR